VLVTDRWCFSSDSLPAGVAGSAGLLIGARAVQGLGAALLPLPLVDPGRHLPGKPRAQPRARALRRHGRDLGVGRCHREWHAHRWTGWRWVFSINVPVGVVLAAMAAIFLPTDMRDPRRSGRFDLGGALTVTDLRAAGGLVRGVASRRASWSQRAGDLVGDGPWMHYRTTLTLAAWDGRRRC
jgi:MFS family permease